jgi:ATP-dependent helicase/nuclease subunit B
MFTLDDKNSLFHLLAEGATVITPNNRLSSGLLQDYFAYCANKTVDKPKCQPYGTFLIHWYQQLNFLTPESSHPHLLNTTQCRYLWQTIIRTTPGITYSEGLLESVIEAWTHCEQWQINPENKLFHYTPQTHQFQLWWHMFNEKLTQYNAINEHQLLPYLIKRESTLFTGPLIWVCFDDFSPQQLKLQEYLKQQGMTQYIYDLQENEVEPQVVTASNHKEEYQQLIQWLTLQIQQGAQRIGVVVPNLHQESRSLHRLLGQHFEPNLFNLSLGQALGQFPLIAHALAWLNLNQTCTSQEAALLLQSPYLRAGKEEFINRAQYLQDSSLLHHQTIPLRTLIQDLRSHAPKLAELLSTIYPYPPSASPQEWISLFQERLNIIGFPGDCGLNSENYQCYNRFVVLFDEFRQLTLISDTLSADEALEALTQLTNNTIFQAQKTNALIHISGLLEASGCEFDNVWVMGLTDQCLPQKIRLSAFIPSQLQRELGMPHSTPARELHFAKQTLQRLRRGSKSSIVFSYAELQGDNPHLPCSLITHHPPYSAITSPLAFDEFIKLIPLDEPYQVNMKDEEDILGGTALLGNQAKCPFKAFAQHRLTAKALPQTTEGIDNKERGKITHRVMELIWQKLGSQKKLFNLSPDDLNQIINQAIMTALSSVKQLNLDSFPHLIQEIEQTRLQRLILNCLEWEKQRPSFAIAAIEQSYSINLAGLEIALRVDRIDQVDNKKWVIDYKSSLPANKPWYEDRPKEPQLLLYALLDEQINTLLLMQVKTGTVLCSGLSEEKQDIKGISGLKKEETWVNSRDTWQIQLTTLAQEILTGHCPPQPAHITLCEQCDFQNLCRFSS